MKNDREIIKEFKCLNCDGKGVEELVSEFLSIYAQALLKHAKMAKHGAGLLSTLLAIKTKNTDHTKYITCSIALLCIMVHFKENPDLVIALLCQSLSKLQFSSNSQMMGTSLISQTSTYMWTGSWCANQLISSRLSSFTWPHSMCFTFPTQMG